MKNLTSLKSPDVLFPELDRAFLSLTEKLIIKGEDYRQSKNWSRFLSKLNQAEIAYVVVHEGHVLYSKEVPQGNFTETISVGCELSKLNVDRVADCQPDVSFIRTFTGLNQDNSRSKNGSSVSFFKSQRLG